MRRYARKDSIKFTCRQEMTYVTGNAPSRRFSGMCSQHVVHVIHHAFVHNSFSAARSFFGRLKNQFHRPRQFFLQGRQDFRHAQPHRRMRVMAAGVHQPRMNRRKAFLAGAMLCRRRFCDIVAIHVKAQRHHRAGPGKTKCPYYRRTATFHLLHKVRVRSFRHRPLGMRRQRIDIRHAHAALLAQHFLADRHLIP